MFCLTSVGKHKGRKFGDISERWQIKVRKKVRKKKKVRKSQKKELGTSRGQLPLHVK